MSARFEALSFALTFIGITLLFVGALAVVLVAERFRLMQHRQAKQAEL